MSRSLPILRGAAVLGLATVLAIFALRLAFPLPERPPMESAVVSTEESDLVQRLAPEMAAHPGQSGVLPLEQGSDAFAARVALARAADATLDVQYYIWQDDLTGIRLLSELEAAAQRGVRVRLLVDDNGTPALDQELAALDALPTADVRIFNPFTLRSARALNLAFDFFRLNRRMHNKSFTADGIATIVGGRNIGDVYFETGAGHTYLDLDVLAVGPAAAEVDTDFERYWTSGSSYPALSLIEPGPGSDVRLAERDTAFRDSPQAAAYAEIVRSSPLHTQLENGELPLEWVAARLFSDDPAKGLGESGSQDFLVRRLMAEMGRPARSFDIVSAYFVPGTTTTARMADFARDGIRVRVLTNALEATDVVFVHAGYAGYRETLLSGGVELWELRSELGERRTVNELGILELSKSALHAKTFAIDGRRAFIGSVNFDARSKRLNTEMGLLIDSPRLAAVVAGWLDANLRSVAYEVGLDPEREMIWTDWSGGNETAHDTEPNTTLPLRVVVRMIGLLPIEWLL